jgi:DNA-binding beta-propeller fold protein YncE
MLDVCLGTMGNTNSTFSGPVGLVRDESSGTLYIADSGNNRVMKYLLNALAGTFAAGSSMFGTGPTQLWKPAGLYFDTFSNSLVIANHNAMNIVQWILGASNWTLLAGNANGVSGNNATLLHYPQHVTFDPMGNMYVVDTNNHRIQLFMVGQTNGITIAGITLTPGSNATLLNTPRAVRLDNQLNLYIADSYNHRIQKFLRY